MKIRDIMVTKSECVGTNDSLTAAAQLMQRHHLASVPVYDRAELVGILTADAIRAKASELARYPLTLRVRDAMERHSHFVDVDDDAEWALTRMQQLHSHHLAVRNTDGGVVGLVSLEHIVNANPSISHSEVPAEREMASVR
jgi:CBS domain-containing protein